MEATANVLKLLESSQQIDINSIAQLRIKDDLSIAIQHARVVGVVESEFAEAEKRKRNIHNIIEDLKGSVRVFCRCRPLNAKEIEEGSVGTLRLVDNMTLKTNDGLEFGFDAAFNPGTQEQVFEDCKDLVQSAIDGYSVAMLAYGQTGAGKTFTMYGVHGNEGVVPRSIREIYRIIDQESVHFTFTVVGSMFELYQNDLIDLLNEEKSTASRKLSIKMDPSEGVQIERLIAEECTNVDSLEDLLDRGRKRRTKIATALNSESSRSHLVFVIHVTRVNRETQETLKGKILFCDLAASQQLKRSQAIGQRQREAIEINKSLAALGDVIEALTKRERQIPYRNHKLTQIMQDSLGGTAKTLMFVNCSPADSQINESLMALKYATRVKQITNTVVKNNDKLDVRSGV
jgi:hypothetical protein